MITQEIVPASYKILEDSSQMDGSCASETSVCGFTHVYLPHCKGK